jgi:hypothetical protein
VDYLQIHQRIFRQNTGRYLSGLLLLLIFFIAQQVTGQAISLQAGRMKSLKKGGKTVQWLRENVRFEQS